MTPKDLAALKRLLTPDPSLDVEMLARTYLRMEWRHTMLNDTIGMGGWHEVLPPEPIGDRCSYLSGGCSAMPSGFDCEDVTNTR